MARSKSSARWLREHFDDAYVQRARKEGYRSRAVYKLKEIQDKDRILRSGMTVVDLGAAPGGWSQYAVQVVGNEGVIVAMDILNMEPLPGVTFIQGDFREQDACDRLLAVLAGRPVDLVISDMAPNTTGIKHVDQPRGMYLSELAVDFARQCLVRGGTLLMKVFHGAGFDGLIKGMRADFGSVVTRKPRASRLRSSETYLLARNYDP